MLRSGFDAALDGARSVLLAGAGGGFDVYAGLPIAVALARRGVEVHLANLTFTYLGGTDAPYLAPHVARVHPEVNGEPRYFPERTLAQFLLARPELGLAAEVLTFEKVGVGPLRQAYRAALEATRADTLVIVDGGTDLLMRGDEAGLGTPEEDMATLAAIAPLAVRKLALCVGFGVDAYHGVCHAHFLENLARIDRGGGYLGAFSFDRGSPEGTAFLSAVSHAQAATPGRPSIVNGSIAAALEGRFGDAQFTSRTATSELFINPLMTLYFGVQVDALVREHLYLGELEGTQTIFDVQARIAAFRERVEPRPWRAIPH